MIFDTDIEKFDLKMTGIIAYRQKTTAEKFNGSFFVREKLTELKNSPLSP